jgi:hypothetical protein
MMVVLEKDKGWVVDKPLDLTEIPKVASRFLSGLVPLEIHQRVRPLSHAHKSAI